MKYNSLINFIPKYLKSKNKSQIFERKFSKMKRVKKKMLLRRKSKLTSKDSRTFLGFKTGLTNYLNISWWTRNIFPKRTYKSTKNNCKPRR